MRADTYPPQNHVLRDMNILVEHKGQEGSTARAPVVPSVCSDQGTMQVGILATLIDALGATLAARVVHPDWIAVTDLSIYSTQWAKTGEVTAVGSILRAGRAGLVIEAEIIAGTTESGVTTTSIGSAVATYSRISRRHGNIDIERDDGSHQVIDLRSEGPGLSQHLLDKAGLRVIDETAGLVELSMTEYVRNSFGALQGGMFAVMSDVAGQYAARTVAHKPMTTADLAICYLSPGKTGPFYTRTKVLRKTEDSVLTRVGIFDRGADDLLMAVAVNTATMS